MADREQRDWAFKALTLNQHQAPGSTARSKIWQYLPLPGTVNKSSYVESLWQQLTHTAGNANRQELSRNQGVCEQGQAVLEEVFMKSDYGWDGPFPPHCLSFPVRGQ